MPKLVVHRRAARYIQGMDARIKTQLTAKLQEPAKNPKSMAGEWEGYYWFRHGDLRIIYLYDQPNDTIVIAHVGPRGDVYK